MLQCLTGVHGAFDRRHHRCASGTRSSTRCCSRAVAVIRLQIQEQIVDVAVPQIREEIVEIVAGEVVCNARTGVSTGGRAHIEQIVDVPVPRILEQHVDVIKVIPEEWMSKRIVQQIVDVPVPQIPKQIVGVVLVILQEQCQRMRFFLLTACGKGAVGGTFHTCCLTAHSHTPGLILSASDGIWNMLFSTCSHTSRWVRFRFGGCLSLVVAHVRPTHITPHEHHVMA